jgi:hypothetical protein
MTQFENAVGKGDLNGRGTRSFGAAILAADVAGHSRLRRANANPWDVNEGSALFAHILPCTCGSLGKIPELNVTSHFFVRSVIKSNIATRIR